ncbi:BCCT family transporter [Henriciella sp. AS95]|uniref:BCCT family transporter n=1 Tax=Henriciella sp. AS95 TaxID=3135782 RepID=UPI00316C4661
MTTETGEKTHQTDWVAFSAASFLVLAVCVALLAQPSTGAVVLPAIYDWIATELGPLYLLAGTATIIFLAWLAFSRFGHVRIGGADAKAEFSKVSWAGMLFCAGVGAGLMYWAAIEWAYYLDTPPFGIEARSRESLQWASAYGLFHWGPSAWAFYCLPTLAIAYAYHNRKSPYLRLSAGCAGFSALAPNTPGGRAIDLIFMISLLGGAGSSLGFTTPMIAALIARMLGIETSFQLEVIAMVVIIALFATSAAVGIKQGIKRLTDLNVWLLFGFLAFVLFSGPTVWLIKTAINATGLVAQNFIRLNSWTEPFGTTDFVKDWTIFYWAWWIAYGPVVGLFVARISRGRTLREIIFGMLGFGTLGAGLFFVILGNYGLWLETVGGIDISSYIDESGGSAAIVEMIYQLPLPALAAGVFCVAAIVFSATTYDSASYILASNATKSLPAGDDPAIWQRLFWALMLGLLPLSLLFVGGQRVVQTAALIASVPLILIGVVMAWSLVRKLKADHPPGQVAG